MRNTSLRLKIFLASTLFLSLSILILDVNFKDKIIEIVLLLLAQWAIVSFLLSPLQKLSHWLSEYNPKDIIELSFEDENDNEIGLIKKSILKISKQSEDYTKRLAQLNTQLEDKVRQRTQELLNKNEHLQKEIISRKEKEKLLIQQSKMAAMGEMISAISHQWKQPLNMLALQLQDVYFKSQLGQLTPQHMVDANENANSLIQFMSHTIDDFRNFFTPEKVYEPFDIRTAIDETHFLVQSIMKSSNIDVHISGENMKVSGLQNEFKQVILNLFNNSRDAILEQREIDKSHKGIIDIKIEVEDSFYAIHFLDTGGGIPESSLETIFEPLYTTKQNGTGLGLVSCKNIIESHKGKIYAQNSSKEGAIFTILIPSLKE